MLTWKSTRRGFVQTFWSTAPSRLLTRRLGSGSRWGMLCFVTHRCQYILRIVIKNYYQVCPRCEFICVDPEMGDKHPNNEPLKTLMKYRFALDPEEKKFYGSNPFFGINLSVEVPGEVHVGDKVLVSK